MTKGIKNREEQVNAPTSIFKGLDIDGDKLECGRCGYIEEDNEFFQNHCTCEFKFFMDICPAEEK